ncbi:MAG: Asp/Glu racemase, partial [Rhodospirillaceae bacterium]|nr:Asp/Glu racemase [Rhodospirillaceae bacterium]
MTGQISEAAGWATMPCALDDGPAPRASIGLITLSTDNVIEAEVLSFL